MACLQDEKDQIITTNCWLNQVQLLNSYRLALRQWINEIQCYSICSRSNAVCLSVCICVLTRVAQIITAERGTVILRQDPDSLFGHFPRDSPLRYSPAYFPRTILPHIPSDNFPYISPSEFAFLSA